MIKNYLRSLVAGHRSALKEQKGQSIIIITFAFVGLIAMLGIALDLGLVYIERVKIGRTTDAAALAAVTELPYEEEAIRRAIEYIRLNGYNVGVDTEVRVRGCINTGDSDDPVFQNVDTISPSDSDGKLDKEGFVPVTYTNSISGYNYILTADEPRAVFIVDTLAYQPVSRSGSTVTTKNKENCNEDDGIYGKANKLRVSGEVMVDMNFMQFFGFGEVPVQDVAVGENVTSLDIAVVFDVSGSMDFETNCFGCWREDPAKDVLDFPFPANGGAYPAHYDPYETNASGEPLYVPTSNLCTVDVNPLVKDTYNYLAHEAEYYSRNNTNDHPQGWLFDRHNPGQGYWVLQRADRGSNYAHIRAHPYVTYSQSDPLNYPQLQGMSYDSECFDNIGQCWNTEGQNIGETAPAISSTVPFVEYDFKVSWGSLSDSSKRDTHIWIRAMGGEPYYAMEWNGQSPDDFDTYNKAIFWKVDDLVVRGGTFTNLNDGPGRLTSMDPPRVIGFEINDNNWRWIKLGEQFLPNGQHTLRLYQGSSGFNVDKIVITNNPWGVAGEAFGNTGHRIGSTSTSATGYTSIRGTLQDNGGRGPDATRGSATREACNVCNPIFGGKSKGDPMVTPNLCSCKKSYADTAVASPFFPAGGSGLGCSALAQETNMLENDLYHDVDPLRSAQEAVKNFASRLDPRFDQLGIVAFTGAGTNSPGNSPSSLKVPRVKLQCLVHAQKNMSGGQACFNDTTGITYTNVIRGLEDHNPNSNTDIPTGMREGLEELGLAINNASVASRLGECSTDATAAGDGRSCDRRGGAKRILILMTDGSPNDHDGCPAASLWRGRWGKNNRAYDCSVYYAREAANNFVTVYTIGIGPAVNTELLTAMAEGTDPNPDPADPQQGYYFESRGGKFYRAAKPSDLDTIFEDILDNIFVRIVG